MQTVKRLLLVGGGHAHVEVLRRFAMAPMAGVEIALVSPQEFTPYSGMLPGFVAGHYRWRECHIEPDWLLIYSTNDDEVLLARTGTHADLFGS